MGPGLRRDDNGIHAQTTPSTPSIPFPHHRVSDSVAFAREILARTKIGLAPGTAFGPMGEGYMAVLCARPGFHRRRGRAAAADAGLSVERRLAAFIAPGRCCADSAASPASPYHLRRRLYRRLTEDERWQLPWSWSLVR